MEASLMWTSIFFYLSERHLSATRYASLIILVLLLGLPTLCLAGELAPPRYKIIGMKKYDILGGKIAILKDQRHFIVPCSPFAIFKYRIEDGKLVERVKFYDNAKMHLSEFRRVKDELYLVTTTRIAHLSYETGGYANAKNSLGISHNSKVESIQIGRNERGEFIITGLPVVFCLSRNWTTPLVGLI